MRNDDASFDLSEDAPALANLPALWRSNPQLAARVEVMCDNFAPAKSDAVDLPLVDRDSLAVLTGTLALASHAWHATGGGDGAAVIIYHAPDERTLATSLAASDVADVLASPRVRLFVGKPDGSDIDARLAPFPLMLSAGLTQLDDVDPTFAAAVERLAERAKTNIVTAVEYGRRTCDNLIGNLRRYVAGDGVGSLKGACAGRPAVLVSAGPSLRRNVEQLKAAKGQFVIVAVQTALKPLLAAGVEPDFICSIDHSEISTRFMEGLPDNLTTRMVAEPKASPAVLDVWARDTSRKVTLLGNDFADGLLREMSLDHARLPASATVAHLAFELIGYLGCSTCILVGQDLGFSDGLAYTPGTGYDDAWRPETGRFCTYEMKQWEHIARDRASLLRVEDWRGNTTYTERRLATYLSQFETMFAASPMRVIDATEGGVAKANSEAMRLADALAEARPGGNLPAFASDAEQDRWDAAATCLKKRISEAEQIVAIVDATVPLLQSIAERPGEASTVNTAVAEIDRLRKPFATERDLDRTYGLCASMTQQTERDRVLADLRIKIAGMDEVEVRRHSARRDLANVAAIGAAARDMASMLRALL